MSRLLTSAVLLLISLSAYGAAWYASPTGAADGDGSIASPWPLHMALQSASVQPGDTLYLRGGNYAGPGFECSFSGESDSYITVTSYPGEWAVLTDGMALAIGTNLPTAVNNDTFYEIPVLGSDTLPNAGYWFRIGDEVSYAHNKSGSNKWTLIRNYSITNHTEGEAVIIEGNFLKTSGSYVRYMDLEITATTLTNRGINTSLGQSGRDGLNMVASGVGNKAIGLVIHNVGHPGIGFWNQQNGGEINGCLLWGNGYYDNAEPYNGAPRGNGIYTQNDAGGVLVKNNIIFRNLTHGVKAFGEGGSANGFSISSNIVFGISGTSSGIHVGTGGNTMTNNFVTNNAVMGNVHVGYACLSNLVQIISGNVCVNTLVEAKDILTGAYTNNMNFLKYAVDNTGIVRFESESVPREGLSLAWDNNTYYFASGGGEQNFTLKFQGLTITAANGGGNLFFQDDGTNSWKDWSGFDEHSTYQVGWPSNYTRVDVIPLDYNTNRWHVSVINTAGGASASVALNAFGWSAGESYSLVDAQNWPVVVSAGTYDGESLSLPLTLTNAATISGVTTNIAHSNIDAPTMFNAFVLTRTSAARHAHTHGSGTLGSSTR